MTDNTKSAPQNNTPVESGTEYKGLRVPPPSGFSLEGGHNVPPPPAALVQEEPRVSPLAINGQTVPPPPPQALNPSGQGVGGEAKPASTPTSSPPTTPSR